MASSTKKSRRSAATTSSGANSDSENGSNRDNEDFEPNSWECTVCTFRNKYEAFKCLMCDTRKGTSTRKPRLNPTVVQQQTLVQKMAVEVEKQQKKNRNSSETRNSPDLFALPSSSGTPTTPTPTGGNLFPTADIAAARKLFVGQQQKAQHQRLPLEKDLLIHQCKNGGQFHSEMALLCAARPKRRLSLWTGEASPSLNSNQGFHRVEGRRILEVSIKSRKTKKVHQTLSQNHCPIEHNFYSNIWPNLTILSE